MKKKQTKSYTEANLLPGASFPTDAAPPSPGLLEHIHLQILNLNGSKLFAGLVMIMLNVGSKVIPVQFSKSVEEYMKLSVSKALLVFAMSWMGTRDIYTALLLTVLFVIFSDYLFNEESMFCIVPHDKRILESVSTNPNTNTNTNSSDTTTSNLSKQSLKLIENTRKKIAGEYKNEK